jgi:hypothetical protein
MTNDKFQISSNNQCSKLVFAALNQRRSFYAKFEKEPQIGQINYHSYLSDKPDK